jgi:uncharacterized protein
MKNFIKSWSYWVIKQRALMISLWVFLVILGGYLGKDIHFDHTIERNFSESDTKIKDFNNLLNLFGDNEYLIVGVSALQGQDIFNRDTLAVVDSLTDFLERQEAVTQVRSITKYQYLRGTEDNLSVEDLFVNQRADNPSDIDINQARYIAGAEPLLQDVLITPELTETRIAARIRYEKESPTHKVELVKNLYQFVAEKKFIEQGHQIHFGGQPIFDEQFETRNKSDSALLYPLMAIIMIAVLWISFRSWYITLLPWAVIIAGIMVLNGIQGLLGYPHSVVDQALVPTMIIIGIGVSIHLIVDFINKHKTMDRLIAAQGSVRELWLPSFFTTATTSIGFIALSVTEIIPIKEMGILGAIGPWILFVASFSLLPAILSYRKQSATTKTDGYTAEIIQNFANTIPEFTLRHRKTILVTSTLLFLATFAALGTIKVDTNFVEYFRKDNPARQDMLYFDKHFDGAMTMEVIIDSGRENGIKEPAFLQRVAAFENFLEERESTGKILSILDFLKEVKQSMNEEKPQFYVLPDTANEAAQLLFLYENAGPEEDLSDMRDFDNRYLRLTVPMINAPASVTERELNEIKNVITRDFSDLSITLTGVKLLFQAQDTYTSQGMIKSFAVSLIVISLFFFVLFRSIRLGLYCIIPSVLPILIVGAATGLLGIPLDLGTMIVGAMTMGLAVDDSIHVVSRYESARKFGLSCREAIRTAMRESGTAVIFSSIILVLGFSILMLGSFIPIVYVGLFSAAIMALALLGDLLLLPAIIYTIEDKTIVSEGEKANDTEQTKIYVTEAG